MLDLTRASEDLQVRWLDQGNQYTAPLGTVEHARWVGAGYPDYPWMFATDGEYTAFASVAMGQFEAIKDHLTGLRDVSEILNDGLGHRHPRGDLRRLELVRRRLDQPRRNGKYNFNTDETVKYPSAVALIWRWTGDDRFRHDLYDFSVRGMRAVVDRLDADGDGWPEGSGNVEREGMGVEKLDNSVYLIRGLYDLADLARAEGDRGDAGVGERPRAPAAPAVRGRLVVSRARPTGRSTPTRSTTRRSAGTNNKQQDKHWIGVTPMEAELTIGGMAMPGLATFDHGDQALALRETDCYSGSRPYNLGLFHTGCGGGPTGAGERTIFGLNTAIQAVGEGNYGRMESASGGTPTPRPSRCSASPTRAARRTSSPARCRRSCRRRTSTAPARTTPTSSAAGAAARCSCRPGATTAPSGRSCTSSSACGRTWGATRWRSCRSCRRARRSRAATSGSARARSTCRPRVTASATARRSTRTSS